MRSVSRILVAAAFSALALGACADPTADTVGAPTADTVGGGGATSDDSASGGSGPDEATSNDGGSQPPASTTPKPTGDPLPAELTVTVDDGSGDITTYTLRCEPAGGEHPDPAVACAGLAAAGIEAFGPPDPGQACTEIYGGPQTATVTGTLAEAPVNATFSRANGCEIARWDALAAVFANAGGVS